ncbi:vWA domain-containing protein [Pollutibacter soli]|uniref:vWA domain-containing protein n=1 Tax=Pollutibacter soli TaxID=3034157 RepID=UPI003013C43E
MRIITFILLIAAGLTFSFAKNETVTIKGMVTDEKGAPLSGVQVVQKKTKNAVTTDAHGNFSITVAQLPATLIVSGVGYTSQEVMVKNQNTQWIMLQPSATKLEEVVVTGYATKKVSDVTGSVSTLIAEPILHSQLQGRAAGVTVTRSHRKQKQDKYFEDEYSREGYDHIVENRYLRVTDNPLSTFSIDVDAASYSNVRRFINDGSLPPAGAVRIEELINYFNYNYPQPVTEDPFAIYTEIANSPWKKNHQLVMIGLQGKKIPVENLPASNLVFLIDVSGSMQDFNKLPLVKSSLLMLVDQLREQDNVAIVVYAGAAGLVLPSTSGSNKAAIRAAIERLEAGGSTAGSAGIRLAYNTALANFKKGGNNRVILCTDGDFNVGESSDDALETLIEKERKSGVFLTVLGYGMGNYQDAKMQKLADKGNGNHAYIDQLSEAKKVLVNEFGGTLFTIAKDVKLQIEFNPNLVQAYRLIGYENRLLNKEDFNNDKKDAGDMGSGHTVTALYEIIPAGVKASELESVDSLKYQKTDKSKKQESTWAKEMMNIKIRYKKPDEDQSKLLVHPVLYSGTDWKKTSENFRLASAVAGYGMLLRNSEFKGNISYSKVLEILSGVMNNDKEGYRKEFRSIVIKTAGIKGHDIEEDEEELTMN